jgi:hypothetical protein
MTGGSYDISIWLRNTMISIAGGEHCQLRAAIEVLVPYTSPP